MGLLAGSVSVPVAPAAVKPSSSDVVVIAYLGSPALLLVLVMVAEGSMAVAMVVLEVFDCLAIDFLAGL